MNPKRFSKHLFFYFVLCPQQAELQPGTILQSSLFSFFFSLLHCQLGVTNRDRERERERERRIHVLRAGRGWEQLQENVVKEHLNYTAKMINKSTPYSQKIILARLPRWKKDAKKKTLLNVSKNHIDKNRTNEKT